MLSISKSIDEIGMTSPFGAELLTRNFAKNINAQGFGCNHFIEKATNNQSQTNIICANEDWSKVEDLRIWVNGTYYEDTEYLMIFTNVTGNGMTEEQLTALYNPSITNSFG